MSPPSIPHPCPAGDINHGKRLVPDRMPSGGSVGRRAWCLVSVFFMFPALAALCLPGQWLAFTANLLSAPHLNGQPCWLCGMTGAFAAIARGDFSLAIQLHAASIPLFGIMFGNGLVAGIAGIVWTVRGRVPSPIHSAMKTERK